jgi:hypothetical protein
MRATAYFDLRIELLLEPLPHDVLIGREALIPNPNVKTHQVEEKTDQSHRNQSRNPCQRRLRFELRLGEIKSIDAVPQNDGKQDKVKDTMEKGRAGK